MVANGDSSCFGVRETLYITLLNGLHMQMWTNLSEVLCLEIAVKL